MTLKNPETRHVRLLLHGPVGSGKSSIINSINSIFQDRVMIGALVSATPGSTFTRNYNTYEITTKQGKALPFVFNDIMGLETSNKEGIHPTDIISAIDGHIPEDYRFVPSQPLSSEDSQYKRSPALSDRVHCLVSVVAADRVSEGLDDYLEKMREVRKHASELKIPQVVFMTRVDLLCPLVAADLQSVYSSKQIKHKMEAYKNALGVPMTCIYPVKNYHEETSLDTNMNSLILDALKNAVMYANDYVGRLHKSSETHHQQPVMHTTRSNTFAQQMETHAPHLDTPQPQELPTLSTNNDATDAVCTALGELDTEWREMDWATGSRNTMETSLRKFQLLNPELKHLRILLHGPVGAGKSSLINSIDTVFQGQVSARALVAGMESNKCFTKKYKTYAFPNGNSGNLPFVVNDMMGLVKGNSDGVQVNDIISALKGHLKNNHKFNPESPLSEGDPDYNSNPTLNERVHCLVSVVSMDTISRMDDDIITQMQAIREAASDLDIPQVIVLTKVDKACPLVKQDLRKIYFSEKIQQMMNECSLKLNVPMNCIFPVRNYHKETRLDQEMDCLVLTALKQIVHFANQYVKENFT
ncbi:interferon-induced protein 44-like [Engraulis encrasicolus]|uniref:interferon-induced protein 44-like n=1 Tax=Engraulis encrasicolus TaxID=184585 RepID=UPI002FD2E597